MTTNNEYLLFATARPSRVSEVVTPDEVLAARHRAEMAFAEKIGMDTKDAAAFTRTGSPTGTKHPHEFDDLVEDILE